MENVNIPDSLRMSTVSGLVKDNRSPYRIVPDWRRRSTVRQVLLNLLLTRKLLNN
jgi:hypothetical protein